MWTGFPSATPSGLALGADLPVDDCHCHGDLRLPADGDLTRLVATYACILSSAASSAPRGNAFAGLRNAPLPVAPQRRESAVSVLRLAPLHCLRPRARPVSCYALFQGMAASEPTSRLSARGDLISHSAQFGDLDRRSGLFPSRPRTLEHAASLPGAGRGHSQFGAGRKASPPPSRSRALPPAALPEAVPKGISGRASYLQVCLAFHSVPRVIAALFNGLPFGPPRGLTPASACPWQDHLGFGSAPRDLTPFRTRFPSGSAASTA